MAAPQELLDAAAAVLDVTDQPQEFKNRLMAVIRNAVDGSVEDRDVTALVAAADVDTDTGA